MVTPEAYHPHMWASLPRSFRSRRAKAATGLAGASVIAVVAVARRGSTSSIADVMQAYIEWAPFLILLCLAVPTVLAIAARPQRGILLVAAIVPYNGLLIIVKHPTFLEGYKEALILWTALWAVMSTLQLPKTRPLPRFTAPLLLWLVVGLISATTVTGTQAYIGLKFMFIYALVIVPIWLCPLNARDRDRLVSIFLLNGVITAIVGLWDQVAGGPHLVSLGYKWGENILTTHGWTRSISTFNQPFPFAFFLMFVLVLGAAVALEEPRRQRSILFFASTPVMVAALAFTFVRAAWVGLVVGFLYLAFRRYNVMLFVVPFALYGLLFLPAGFSKAQFESNSFQERRSGWAQNLSAAADPFGNGIGSTGSAAIRTRKLSAARSNAYQPDSYYYKVLYELGIFGLWFFLLAVISGFMVTLPLARRPGLDGAIGMAIGAHVLGAVTAAFFATYLEIFPANLFFWMLIGLAATTTRREPLTIEEQAAAEALMPRRRFISPRSPAMTRIVSRQRQPNSGSPSSPHNGAGSHRKGEAHPANAKSRRRNG
jgi:putative inorganic carbon (HCO3(-)) transporter